MRGYRFCRVALGTLIAAGLTGCALPPDAPTQYFVPQAELRGVAIARQGIYFLSQNQFVDAELRFLQALYLRPEAENLKLNLVAVLEGQGRFDEAEKLLAPILERKPDDPDLLLRQAHLKVNAGRFDEGKALYRKLLEMADAKPDYALAAKAVRNLKVVTYQQGFSEDALCYSSLLIAYQNDADAVLEHARLLLALGLNEDALDIVSGFQAERNLKGDSRFNHTAAMAQLAVGHFKEAWQLERTAIKGGKFDVALEREINLVRILCGDDQSVASSLNDDDRAELSKLWNEVGGSVNLSAREALGWPALMVRQLEAKLMATPPE